MQQIHKRIFPNHYVYLYTEKTKKNEENRGKKWKKKCVMCVYCIQHRHTHLSFSTYNNVLYDMIWYTTAQSTQIKSIEIEYNIVVSRMWCACRLHVFLSVCKLFFSFSAIILFVISFCSQFFFLIYRDYCVSRFLKKKSYFVQQKIWFFL